VIVSVSSGQNECLNPILTYKSTFELLKNVPEAAFSMSEGWNSTCMTVLEPTLKWLGPAMRYTRMCGGELVRLSGNKVSPRKPFFQLTSILIAGVSP
jgi:hypothetical protein